jgi:hypothetical protein
MKAADPVTDLERVFLKEKLLRFAVGSRATGFSSIWSAWSYQNDFYLGVRATLGDMKVSLHESLVCNYGMTERSATLPDPSGQRDRAIVKWRRRPAPSSVPTSSRRSVSRPPTYACLSRSNRRGSL